MLCRETSQTDLLIKEDHNSWIAGRKTGGGRNKGFSAHAYNEDNTPPPYPLIWLGIDMLRIVSIVVM